MKTLPENIRKLMSAEDREKLNQHTISEIRPKYDAKLERELQKQIYQELNRREMFFCWSRTDKKTRGVIGTPDFIFPYEGKFIAIECKANNLRKLTSEQNAALEKIEKQGGFVFVVYSFDGFWRILQDLHL